MSLRARLGALGGHVAIATLATWPMVLNPATRLLGHPAVDVWNHAWGAWWFLASFRAGELPFYTTLLGAPRGGYLWYIDPLGALATMPIVALGGLALAWNVLMLGYLALASAAGRALALALGAPPVASWLAAVATALSPFLLSEVHNGISEAVGACWCLFALAALFRAVAPGSGLRNWATLGLFAGITAVGTVYYAIGLALLGAPVVLAAAGRDPRRVTRGAVLALVVAAVVTVPAFLAVRHSIIDPATALIERPDVPLEHPGFMSLVRHNAVDPRVFFWPGDFQSVDHARTGEHFRHSSYAGLVVIALALFTRRWALLALVAGLGVMSLGTFLYFDGDWVRVGGQMIALPYRLLFEVLPTAALGHPQRLALPGLALLYGLAAAGLGRVGAGTGPGALLRVTIASALVAVEFLAFSPAPWPLATAGIPDSSAAEYIRDAVAADPSRAGIVFDLPADTGGEGMAASQYLYSQSVHGQPIPYTPDVRVQHCKLGNHSAGVLLRRDDARAREVNGPSLAGVGVRWIVVHGDLVDTTFEERALTAALGEPVRLGALLVYAVEADPPRR